jgi:hypothetical protein
MQYQIIFFYKNKLILYLSILLCEYFFFLKTQKLTILME